MTKFFTNSDGNTLFEKFKGIAQNMADFHSFHAVVGFFRSSGYFKLREELKDVAKIQILVGINIDAIFQKHNRAMLMLESVEKAKTLFNQDFVDDVKTARYSAEVERGILQLGDDLSSGKVEMKIHTSKNLHAKFYLCLPSVHSEHTDGRVIMGSSNISEAGLGLTQPPRYELNVAMKDYDDVAFCKAEFDRLWAEGVPLTADDMERFRRGTYIGESPTPYELYMKVLIDSFGSQVEDEFSMALPDNFLDLKYQQDAVKQGYQMLCDHNGFFLADVVGLGKTIVAAMIAQRFVETNGRNTNILVVYPPALKDNWKETFKSFRLDKKTQFVSNGSLSKILDGKDNYKDKTEFDLVIVDEAHGFRNESASRYDELQRICKSRRQNAVSHQGERKKVMLLSATPLNNRPNDLLNQILLFQDAQRCTIEGVSNLQTFFSPKIERYAELMRNRHELTDTSGIDAIYEDIRNKVLDKITIRRTRSNIWNDDDYRKDLEAQKIQFPDVGPPNDLTYQLSPSLGGLFYDTLNVLMEDLTYARYRAIEFLDNKHQHKFKNAAMIGENLAGIFRIHMVKRLESSFYAFRRSLDALLQSTDGMIKMFDEGKVIIAPDLKIKELQAKGWELDTIIEHAIHKGYNVNDIIYSPKDFVVKDGANLRSLLEADRQFLEDLKTQWNEVTEDPKLDLFVENLQSDLFDKKRNPTGKLVVFSESVDTANYLTTHLKERLKRRDILSVCAADRHSKSESIRRCFDANYSERSDDYNIIITSDVLAEGVNLHRANVIVNYDSPWNATRLIQRIGRVNRIGSVAGAIHNYMFYPSAEGEAQIRLYKNALFKLQGVHSALGEDAQIYSKEEILKVFQLYNPKVKDKVDKQLALLREVRALYHADRALYKKIKALPMKSRTARRANEKARPETTLAFISSPRKTEYYKVTQDSVEAVTFLEAASILKAPKDEPSAPFPEAADTHFAQVNRALEAFRTESIVQQDTDSLNDKMKSQKGKSQATAVALKFLRDYCTITEDDGMKQRCDVLSMYIQNGVYVQLERSLRDLSQDFKGDRQEMRNQQGKIDERINILCNKYDAVTNAEPSIDNTEPNIVISETFV